MKSRILDTLYAFSKLEVPEGNRTMFNEISKELKLDPTLLRQRASETLRLILHNYTFFEILTIDKFTHKIIRTFSKELKISQHFEVALDTELLLDEAITQLLFQVGNNDQMTKILVDFSLEKVDAAKNWDIVHDLKKIGKLLFEENHYTHLKALESIEIAQFLALKSLLSQKVTLIQSEVVEQANDALQLIAHLGFLHEDFPRQTLPNHFLKIQTGETDPGKLYKNQIEENLISGNVVKKSVQQSTTVLSSQLLSFYWNIKEKLYQHKFFKNAYRNIVPLTVLNEIAKEVKKVQEDRELLHISEFNKLISKEIRNQPAPYIYERLGERYRHYFIDEFQDTSTLQWRNLIPLIGNALESENLKGERGSLFLVGDAKQSIYRWRGGNPEQLVRLCNKEDGNPFSIAPTVHHLDTNWRSYDVIIHFNNGFFKAIASKLTKPEYKTLYQNYSTQKVNHRKGGFVEISFLKEAESSEEVFYLEGTLQTIQKITDNGFNFRDITLLVRKNEQGIHLANYLTTNNIPVISSEALLLKNNAEVAFLVALLRFIDQPEEKTLQYEVLEYLLKDLPNTHDRISEHLGALPEFLTMHFSFHVNVVASLSVLDILEKAIAIFDLAADSNAYVTYFMDKVLEMDQKYGMSIHDFIEFWELKKAALAISTPDDLDAVTVMTIHKSKGLEFNFVVFPFADSKVNDSHQNKSLWAPVDHHDFLGFRHLHVNASYEIEFFSEASKNRYLKEIQESELDHFNLLYVALTRAVFGLFILTADKKGESYGALLRDYLQQLALWNDSRSNYTFGSFPKKDTTVSCGVIHETIPYGYSEMRHILSKIAVSSTLPWNSKRKDAIARGNILHAFLAQIHSEDDIENAVREITAILPVNIQDQHYYRDIALKIVRHSLLKKYYKGPLDAKNEAELLDTDGTLLRPDRLIFRKEGLTIIDYKTGEFSASHRKQLESYAFVLQKMGFVVLEKILIYIGENIKPTFI